MQAALERGFETLGFSDHTPYCFPDGYVSGFRMRMDQLQDYCNIVRLLQKKYADRIRIPLGVEMEYYPAYFADTLQILRDAGIEYMLLGQHFVGNEMGEHYSGRATGDAEILKRYCRQAMEGMNTGLFTYLAHPDLIHFVGDEQTYRHHMRQLCREARSCEVPLEVNMLGSWAGRNYPNPVFWELAAEEGCHVILGCDAHAPDHLQKEDTEKKLLGMIRDHGLPLLERVELRKIK